MTTTTATVIVIEIGLECPQCGGRDLRAKDTRKKDGFIQRKRTCVACGKLIVTHEKCIFD